MSTRGAGRGLRVIQTGDWHLGHRLQGMDRAPEHAAFLAWLETTIATEQADALLVCGDVYDTANPPVAAERLFYDFLSRLAEMDRAPAVVVIAGNHDSAARIAAAGAVLESLDVYVRGRLAFTADGTLDVSDALVPLWPAGSPHVGPPAAVCVCVPFARSLELSRAAAAHGLFAEGEPFDPGEALVRTAGVLRAAAAARFPAARRVVLGHLFAHGGAESGDSERQIVRGGAEAVSGAGLVGTVGDGDAADAADFVALGHLHRAQRIDAPAPVHYAGSPIPLAFGERDYTHSVLRVDLPAPGDTAPAAVKALTVPRMVDLVRVPAEGYVAPEDVPDALAASPLVAAPALSEGAERPDRSAWPFVEVNVLLSAPRPGLRQEVEGHMAPLAARLLRTKVENAGDGLSLHERGAATGLDQMAENEVFHAAWMAAYGDAPPADVQAAFDEALHIARSGEAP